MGEVAQPVDTLVSAVEAGRRFGYTNDYIARLAREKKIMGTRVGRQWFIDADSLQEFVHNTEEIKRQNAERLRAERLKERVVINEKGAAVQVLPMAESRALVLAKSGLVLCASVVVGAVLYNVQSVPHSNLSTASVVEILRSLATQLYGNVASTDMPAAVHETQNVSEQVMYEKQKETEGMVVVPPGDSRSLEDVRDNFSDEVQVEKDADSASGIIRPKFKSGDESVYRYMLVPIDVP